jgi:hypothetical protein
MILFFQWFCQAFRLFPGGIDLFWEGGSDQKWLWGSEYDNNIKSDVHVLRGIIYIYMEDFKRAMVPSFKKGHLARPR